MKGLLSEELKGSLDTKEKVVAMKHAAINAFMYDFASALREFEKEKFPEEVDEELEKITEKVVQFNVLLSMVEIKADLHNGYKFLKVAELWNKKGLNVTLEDGSKIIVDSNKYFR